MSALCSKEDRVIIRKLEDRDLAQVSSVCLNSFMKSVAPSLSDVGISTFQKISSVDSFTARLKENIDILVCEENEKIQGIIELKDGRHISMLFVSPEHQKQGVGRSLLLSIMSFTTSDTITVSASLTSVNAYLSFGFVLSGGISEASGLRFQPMKLELNKG